MPKIQRAVPRLLVLAVLLVVVVFGLYALYHGALLHGHPAAVRLLAFRLGDAVAGQRVIATDVEVELSPGEGLMTGRARLTIKSNEPERRSVQLFLNPGLQITSAIADGMEVPVSATWCSRKITLPNALAPDEHVSLELQYEGTIQPAAFDKGWMNSNEVMLPPRTCWYPMDLKSFSDFKCAVTLPQDFQVVATDISTEAVEGTYEKRCVWQEQRPVFGVALIAGRYEQEALLHAGTRYAVYWPRTMEPGTPGLLEFLAETHEYLRDLFGSDGFAGLNLVLSESVEQGFNSGNSIVAANIGSLRDAGQRRIATASLVAQNWWGGKVTGRWLSNRPGASAWLVHGLADYCGWLALREKDGREAFLRYLERLRCPETLQYPLCNMTLLNLPTADDDSTHFLHVRGPYVVSLLSELVGRENFLAACNNFLRIHEYHAVSYAAFIQELRLASEIDIEPMVRMWLEQPGTVDYAIVDAQLQDDRIQFLFENRGDARALSEIELAIFTEAGIETRKVDPKQHTDMLEFATAAPPKRLVLDPAFALPDMARANNVWPRRVWPGIITAEKNGCVALAAKPEWTDKEFRTVAVIDSGNEAVQHTQLATGFTGSMHWSPDGKRLAFADAAGSVFLWDFEKGYQRLAAVQGTLAGWRDDETLIICAPGNGWKYLDLQGVSHDWLPGLETPVVGSVEFDDEGECLAYIGRKDRELHVVELAKQTERLLTTAKVETDSLRWASSDDSLVFFGESNRLFRLDRDNGSLIPLLELGYSVNEGSVGPSALWAVWRDPAGIVRTAKTTRPDPQYLNLEGEVVDLAWQDSETLICLMARPPATLPMRFHSEYVLLRVPLDTGEPQELDIDPTDILRPEEQLAQ